MFIPRNSVSHLIEIINNEDLSEIKTFIVNNNVNNKEEYQYNREDILICSINYDASLNLIKYIVLNCGYENLNYSINYSSPLSKAIEKCNFKVANYLIEQGADISFKIKDKNLYFNLLDERNLNLKIVKYLESHSCTINYNDIFDNISKFNNFYDYISIFEHYLFDESLIINLLNIYKNGNSLSKEELINIIEKQKFSAILYYNLRFTKYEKEKVKFFIKYDKDLFFNKEKSYYFISFIGRNFDVTNIDLLFTSELFSLENIDFYQIISYVKNNSIIFEYFIERLFQHETFNFKYIHLYKMLSELIFRDFPESYDYEILYVIEKAFQHKSFDFKYISLEEIFSLLCKINYGDREKIGFTFFEKALKHPSFDLGNENSERIIALAIKKDISYKDIITNLMYHKTFNFDKLNFENLLLTILRKSRHYQENIEFLMDKALFCPTFSIEKINIKNIILMFKKRTKFTEVTFNDKREYAIKLLKLFIKNLFKFESFAIKNTDLIISSLETDIEDNVLEKKDVEELIAFTVNNILSNKLVDFGKGTFDIKLVIQYINKVNDETTENISSNLLDNLINHETLEFDKSILNDILSALDQINDIFFSLLFIEKIIGHKKFKNSEDHQFFLEIILFFAIEYDNRYIIKNIINELKFEEFIDKHFLYYEKNLLKASKMNLIPMMELLIQPLLNSTLSNIQDIGKNINTIHSSIIINHEYFDTTFLTLIINILIQLNQMKILEYIIDDKKLKNKININSRDKNNNYPIITALYTTTKLDNEVPSLFQFLVEHGASINVNDSNGNSLLQLALKNKNYQILNYLLKENSLVESEIKMIIENDPSDILKNYQEIINQIKSYIKECFSPVDNLKSGSVVLGITMILAINRIDENGYSALHYAILKNESIELIKDLIVMGKDKYGMIDKKDTKRKYPLDMIVQLKYKELISIIFQDQKILVDSYDGNNENLIRTLLKMENYSEEEKIELLKLFFEKGIKIPSNNEKKRKKSAVTYCCKANSIPLIKYLISKGLNKIFDYEILDALETINTDTFEFIMNDENFKISESFVKEIIDKNRVDLMSILTSKKDIKYMTISDKRYNALDYSLIIGNKSMAKYLIHDHNYLINYYSTLPIIIRKNYFDIMEYLVENKFNINHCSSNCNESPLYHAIYLRNEKIKNYLIKNQSDFSLINNKIRLIEEIMEDNSNEEILEIYFNNNHFYQILKELITKDRLDIIKFLIEHHLEVNKKYTNDDDNTIIIYAIENQKNEIVKYLLNHGAIIDINKFSYETISKIFFDKNRELFKILIDNHLDINKIYSNGKSLLISASEDSEIGGINYLIENGAEVHHLHFSMIKEIIECGVINLIKFFLTQHIKINIEYIKEKRNNGYISWSFYYIEQNFKNEPIIKKLKDLGATIYNSEDYMKVKVVTFSVREDKIKLLQFLVQNHYTDINTTNERGETPLIYALKCENMDDEIINYLIAYGKNITSQYTKNEEIILIIKYLIYKQNRKLISLILENNANNFNLNQDDENGLSILNYAIECGDDSMVKFLIEYGADIHREDRNKDNALTMSICKNNKNLINYFLECGSDINASSKIIHRIGHLTGQEFEEIVRFFVDKQLDINMADDNGLTLLLYAILNKNKEIVYYLMKKGTDTEQIKLNNIENSEVGHTFFELYKNIVDMSLVNSEVFLDILINNNYNINKAQYNKTLPLIYAIQKRNVQVIQYLVRHGANINEKVVGNRYGYVSPLYYIIQNENERLLFYFMRLGVRVESLDYSIDLSIIEKVVKQFKNVELFDSLINYYGIDNALNMVEPLNLVMKEGNEIFIKCLMKYNPDLNKKDMKGRTAIYYPVLNNNIKLVRYLIKHGANINEKLRNCNTPLILAIKSDRTEMAEFLIDHGADINQVGGKENLRPIEYAIRMNMKIALYLIEKGAYIDYDRCSYINSRYNKFKHSIIYERIKTELKKYK